MVVMRITKLPALITAAFLIEHGACRQIARKFREVFPDGAEVTLANVRKAHQSGLSLHWIAALISDDSNSCPVCLELFKHTPDVPTAVYNAMIALVQK